MAKKLRKDQTENEHLSHSVSKRQIHFPICRTFVALAEQRCPSIPKVASLSCEKVAAQTTPRWFFSLNFRSFFVLLFLLSFYD